MKLLSYRHGGLPSFGALADGGVVDLKSRLGGDFADLNAVLAGGALERCRALARGRPDFPLDGITFLPVLPASEKIVCIGRNYMDHIREMAMEPPQTPAIFLKMPSALAAHEQEIWRPSVSECFDFEAELAVVIGHAGRHIAEADAWEHVAGYTILNDGSIRDWQNDNLMAGKNFPRTSGFGPYFVTADEVPEPENLSVVSRLNGKIMQDGNTSDFIFSIPRMIAYISGFTALRPGDVISTGSPSGVAAGRTPSPWLKPGDVIEVEIERLGILRNRVVAEPG